MLDEFVDTFFDCHCSDYDCKDDSTDGSTKVAECGFVLSGRTDPISESRLYKQKHISDRRIKDPLQFIAAGLLL